MTDVTMEMESKNLVVENEIVNSDNPEVETVTINDTESENNSDQNQGDTSTKGDSEGEIAASDHTDDETVNGDDAEDDEPSVSEKSEEKIVNGDGAETESELAASDTGGGNIDAQDETGVIAATENLVDTEFQEDSEVQKDTDDEGDETAPDDIGDQDYKEVPDEIASIDDAEDYKEATGENANSDAAGGKLPDEDQMVDGHDTEMETLSSDAEDETEIVGSDMTINETGISENTEAEAASDDTEVETSSEEKEIETSASEESEEEIASDYDTELESGLNDGTCTEIVGSDFTEPDTENGEISKAEAASDDAEGETATNDKAETVTGNSDIDATEMKASSDENEVDNSDDSEPKTADTDTVEGETTSSATSAINQPACDADTQVPDDKGELSRDMDLEKSVKDFTESDKNLSTKKFKGSHEIVEVSIHEIVQVIQWYPRVKKNIETIDEYKEALLEGATFPTIVVFRVGEKFLLADGSYRVGAHKRAGLHTIPAIVHEGGRKEALLHALGANANHGLRRTNADKEKAVNIALKEPYTRGLSDNQIAEICKVSQPYVSKIRHLLTNNGYKLGRTRLTANGRTMNVTKIGKKKKVVTGPTDPVKEKEGAGNQPPEIDPVTKPQGLNPGGSGDKTILFFLFF